MLLTGKYRDPAATRRYDGASERGMSIGDKVVEIARRLGRTPAQVAINRVRQRPGALVIPVLGARCLAQMQENLGALDFELPDDCLPEIDGLSSFRAGFPWDFLHDEEVIGLVHGKTYPQIDNHRAER